MKKIKFCRTEEGNTCLYLVVGEIISRIDEELPKVIGNIIDPRTSAKKAREIVVKIKFTGSEERTAIGVVASVFSKLQPAGVIISSLNLIPDENGEVMVAVPADRSDQTKLLL